MKVKKDKNKYIKFFKNFYVFSALSYLLSLFLSLSLSKVSKLNNIYKKYAENFKNLFYV